MAQSTLPACTWEFSHPERRRLRCQLPAGTRGYCIFHSGEDENDFVEALQREVAKEDHWLEGARMKEDLSDIRLLGARLPGASFEGRRLKNVVLTGALLEGANFRGAQLEGVLFDGASLRKAAFDRATFLKSKQSPVDFRHCDLGGASFTGARVGGARLLGISFSASTSIAAFLHTPSFELEVGNWDEAASVFAALGKRAAEDWDFPAAEKAAYLAMSCRHRRAIAAGPLSGRSWFSDWMKATLRARWLGLFWLTHRAAWGYGLRPMRLWAVMMVVVILFGVGIFPLTGLECNGDCSLFDTLILSANTFVTLTHSPVTPKTRASIAAAGLEAWGGTLLVSLFLVALAGKYLRRFNG